MSLRIGVDLGGTKISVAVLDRHGREKAGRRIPTPHGEYENAVEVLAALILDTEREVGELCTVGIGMPGTISPVHGRVINAYNTPYNGRPLKRDLQARLSREVRFANDANCFALSEAIDGAARGAEVVFGAILGTGVGGGVVVNARVLNGRNAIAGEWGHTPLPWMRQEEYPGPPCYCGRVGCIEHFLSGRALAREKGALGDADAMALYENRLARGLAKMINVLDPDVIVLGGGVSNIAQLYVNVPPILPRYVYSDNVTTPIVPAVHGDDSGLRGAAMLWT